MEKPKDFAMFTNVLEMRFIWLVAYSIGWKPLICYCADLRTD
jgi:hypothetical protein